MNVRHRLDRIGDALVHARFGIKTVALAYAIGVLAGLLLAHAGNSFALRFRDRLVGSTRQNSTILRQAQKGRWVAAASLDAGSNAAAGLLSGIAGVCLPVGCWVAGYRGWVFGVVSVNNLHQSRLNTRYGALYYITILLLQLVPYTLIGGAGVNLGIAIFARPARTGYEGRRVRWLHIPFEAIEDAGWIYLIALPMFAVASLFEFAM